LPSLIPLFLFLHILSISVWIAAALWLAGDVKRTVAAGKPHVDLLPARLAPQLALDSVGAVGTFATGILIMWAESWAPPRPGIGLGIVFAIARGGVLGYMRGAIKSVVRRTQAGETVPAGDPAVRRIGMLSGIGHALWLLALAGMVFPY
jgi:hypothetical protein